MIAEDIKLRVREAIASNFPSVCLVFEQKGDDANDVGVYVYGVEMENVELVETLILKLDWELCQGTDVALTPHVKDAVTTERYYSHFSLSEKPKLGLVAAECESYELSEPLSFSAKSAWKSRDSSPLAANEELALAA